MYRFDNVSDRDPIGCYWFVFVLDDQDLED